MSACVDSDYLVWGETGGVCPFEPKNVNPASIDLTMDNLIRTPRWYWRTPLMRSIAWKLRRHLWLLSGDRSMVSGHWNDPKIFSKYTLWPGDFVLCATVERIVMPAHATGMLFLKSSAGRMGFEHSHSAYVDPGFTGSLTMELTNSSPWPLELVAGARLIQLVLMETTEPPTNLYGVHGHYQGQMIPTVSYEEPYGYV